MEELKVKKAEKAKADSVRYNRFMTLKPKKKIRRKNKTTRLQELYSEGKVTSEEFYHELIKFIKSRLMPDLIRRGYYVNGVRQTSFTRDECDSCYTHVLKKVLTSYSAEEGTLATYVRWQIRGWGQLIIQKQVRKHKYLPKGTVSLDNTNIYNIKFDEYKNNCITPEDIENRLDYENRRNSILDDLTLDDIETVRKGISSFWEPKSNFGWLVR